MGYVSATYTDYSELIDAIKTECLAEGWTVTDVNTATGNPGYGLIGREIIAQPPGDAVRAAGGYIGFGHVFADDSSNPYITMCVWGATGLRWLPAITTVSITSNVVTIVFDSAHGLVNGDLINWNGNATAQNNRTVLVTNGVTVTNPTTVTLTVQSNSTVTVAPGAGGTAWQVFNQTIYRTFKMANSSAAGRIRLPTSGGGFTARFVVTKFAVAGILTQTNSNHPFFGGLTGLEHVQALQSSVGKLTAEVVSDGVAASVMSLDRAMDNSYVGGTVRVIPQDRLGPVSVINVRECSYTGVAITAKPAANQITAVVPEGTYPIGSLVGFDPMPIYAGGQSGGNNLALPLGAFAHREDGLRQAGCEESFHAVYLYPVFDTDLNAALDPNPSNQYGGGEMSTYTRWNTGNPVSVRRNLRPFVLFVVGPQSNFDLMRTGPASEDPDHLWVICVSLAFNGRALALGPGAT